MPQRAFAFLSAVSRTGEEPQRARPESEAAIVAALRDPETPEALRHELEEALFQLVRARIGQALDGFCGALVGMERDDLISEVYLRLRRSAHADLRRPFIRKVARQIVQSKLRNKGTQVYRQERGEGEITDRVTWALEALADTAPPLWQQLTARELLQRVTQHLGRENAAPLILNAVYGWEHQEIAAWLGIHEEASKKRAQRAAARLRALAESDETMRALLDDEA